MKKILLLTGFVLAGLASCDKFLDINQDPNSPQGDQLTPSLIFPGAEMNLATHYGDYFRIQGGYYAQHYSQTFGTSNYTDYSRFIPSATSVNRSYTGLNILCLKNLESVREKATAGEEWGTYLAATVLRAFTFQVLADAFGEIPYSEALDIANTVPHYDEGQAIYDGILAEIDEALGKASSSSPVCTNFLFGTSTAAEWIQLANALKLKILMRQSNIKNVSSQVAALIAENNFPAADVAWSGIWADASGKANPFYQEEFATYFGSTQQNVIGNLALMKTLQDVNDGRLGVIFDKNASGAYKGGISGTNYNATTDNAHAATTWCRPIMKYNSPVYLITLAEIEFFLAEYYARYGSAGDAQAHYEAAIEASFATLGVAGASAIYSSGTYAYNNADYKKLIGIQKWVALSGVNNYEAWCELRRLKFPTFGSVTGNNLYDINAPYTYTPDPLVAGTLYTPISVNPDLGANKVLQRFKYPESSTARNANVPAPKGDGTPVFWAAE
ncbi:hypothetical protein FACS189452_08560 [Bacteroidia bacterium]|nr:hypothetical protein FACS189452_08560 [Bacteroidia bacterium]GHT80206.1 hypothetical protein FACS189467_1790 [Bacteroidia bacterium]